MLSPMQIEKQNELLKRLKLYSDTCDGSGRLYFREKSTFTQRIRHWWAALPVWKRGVYFGVATFAVGLAIVLAIFWYAGVWN